MPEILINIPAGSTPEKTLGVKLRVLRAAAGLSQESLGEAIGIGANTVGRMESGEALHAVVVARWVRYCGQSLDRVL